jgi:DNA-directed RNA polymerase specialized sigma subunit
MKRRRRANENLVLERAQQLSREEEHEHKLVAAYKAGDSDAGGRLIESQIAWVVACVNKHNLPGSVEFDDVLSELTLVLLESIKGSFDPERSALSTFVSCIVARRTGRIVRRLSGFVKTNDESQAIEMAEDRPQRDERLDELADAVWLSGIKPIALRAVELHLSGIKDDGILEHLRREFSCANDIQVKRLIRDTLDAIRESARKLGSDVPDTEQEQPTFW